MPGSLSSSRLNLKLRSQGSKTHSNNRLLISFFICNVKQITRDWAGGKSRL
jgi:hypothetical protein